MPARIARTRGLSADSRARASDSVRVSDWAPATDGNTHRRDRGAEHHNAHNTSSERRNGETDGQRARQIRSEGGGRRGAEGRRDAGWTVGKRRFVWNDRHPDKALRDDLDVRRRNGTGAEQMNGLARGGRPRPSRRHARRRLKRRRRHGRDGRSRGRRRREGQSGCGRSRRDRPNPTRARARVRTRPTGRAMAPEARRSGAGVAIPSNSRL